MNTDKNNDLVEDNFSSESDEGQEPSKQDDQTIDNFKTLRFQPDSLPWRNVHVILAGNEEHVYFLGISQFTPGTPDLVLHATNKDGPVLGNCHFKWGGSIHCGLGNDALHMKWTEMKHGRGVSKFFRFEHAGRRYTMSRTSDGDHGITGYRKALVGHYKVVDDESGELLAVYVKESIGRRRGVLHIKPDLDLDLEKLIILGTAAWREKMRRKTNMGGRRVF